MSGFRNRAEAGRALADALAAHRPPFIDPVILALPRGGVPIGLEVARRLRAPLDLVMVRKLGAPDQPELAAGAVVNGDDPQLVVNPTVAAWAGLEEADLRRLAQEQLKEIRRRRALYLKDRAQVPLAGRSVIVVDDGVATGATVRAALKAVRKAGPYRLTLAIPVAPPDTLEELRADVDDLVCLESPRFFQAIGAYYGDFHQVADDEVIGMLKEAEGYARG